MSNLDQTETQHFDNAQAGNASTYVLLDVSDRGVYLPKDFGPSINISNQNLLIYAENVTITDDIKWPGKNIAISCSSLTLQKSSVTIDVSGAPADGVAAVASGNGTNGNQGGKAGSIWLYVEQLTPSNATGLRLLANGGSGGEGGNTSDLLGIGGVGGQGGNGGTISYLWSSQAGVALVKLFGLSVLAWTAVIGQSQVVTAVTAPLLPTTQYSATQATLDLYSKYIAAVGACRGSVNNLLKTTKPLSKSLSTALAAFSQGLSTLLAAHEGPDLQDDGLINSTSAVNTAATQYLANLKVGKAVDEPGLQAALAAATVPWTGTPDSALRQALIKAASTISPLYQSLSDTVENHCQIIQGTGGVGGTGSGLNPRDGARGSHGTAGTFTYKELAYDGRADDLNVAMAYAFPDQCQMLLNKANALFFQNTPLAKQDASVLYGRILKRLSFWPTLSTAQQAPSTTPPTPESTLAQSYEYLEYILQVTLSTSDQLQSVYSQAKSFSNQIISGNDMFGHNPLWVPRLNCGYYTSEIMDYIDTLKSVEAAYRDALSVKASLTDISAGQNASASGIQRAQYRIQLLTDDNGPLTSSADTIARYTPLLKDKVQECKDNLTQVTADIQASINIDPLDILSGLSMVAMAPTVPLALVEGAKVVYDADTTIKDNSGATIQKDYVISELGQAGSTLSGVAIGFATRGDQTIEAADPGGLKLIAAADQIESLYTQFKASIPPADGAALIKSLTDLQELATTRNNAVIAYNSAIELLHQAITDEAYYTKQELAYGDQAAKAMNPGLPSILLWLRRTKDNYALETMRLLNYANRAIAYWGLVSPANFASPGPLQDSQAISVAKLTLDQNAEDAITAFAGSAPAHFPVTGRQGALYKLNFGQIISLQNPLTSEITKDTFYSVTIKLAPGVTDDSQDLPLFAGRANIRVDLVRLWLIGASVSADQSGAKPISVVITQLGNETMQNDRRATFNFQHDSVTIPFLFDSDNVESLKDCNDSRILEKQFLANYYVGQGNPQDTSIAAIGPWSTWTFEIRQSENKDLDMSGLTDAYIEFGGYCSPFKVSMTRQTTPMPDSMPVTTPRKKPSALIKNGIDGHTTNGTGKTPRAIPSLPAKGPFHPRPDLSNPMKPGGSATRPRTSQVGTKSDTRSKHSRLDPVQPGTKSDKPGSSLTPHCDNPAEPGRKQSDHVGSIAWRLPASTSTKNSPDHTGYEQPTGPSKEPKSTPATVGRKPITHRKKLQNGTGKLSQPNPPVKSPLPTPPPVIVPTLPLPIGNNSNEAVGVPFQIATPIDPIAIGSFVNFLYDTKFFRKLGPDPSKGLKSVQFTPLQAGETKIGVVWSSGWQPITTIIYNITISAASTT